MNSATHAVHTVTVVFSGAQFAICAQHAGHSLPTIDFVWLRTIGKHLEGIVLAECTDAASVIDYVGKRRAAQACVSGRCVAHPSTIAELRKHSSASSCHSLHSFS